MREIDIFYDIMFDRYEMDKMKWNKYFILALYFYVVTLLKIDITSYNESTRIDGRHISFLKKKKNSWILIWLLQLNIYQIHSFSFWRFTQNLLIAHNVIAFYPIKVIPFHFFSRYRTKHNLRVQFFSKMLARK